MVQDRATDYEMRARRAAQIMNLGYWDADFNNNILAHNDEYVSIHGFTPGTVITHQFQINALLHPEDHGDIVAEFADVDEAQCDYTIEYRIIRPDGEIAYIREVAEVVYDPSGTPIGHTGISQDVTKERENQRQLQQALSDAEESLRARDDFLANMSHELRTPLNAISGYSEFLTLDTDASGNQERVVEYGGLIHRAAQHLTDVIGDLLTQAELRRGTLPLTSTNVPIVAFFEETVGIVGLRGSLDNGAVSFSVSPDNAEAIFDRRLIGQALINVLGNAVKYAGVERGITIGYSRNDGDFQLWVQDNGDGIPENEVPQITEPFFRGLAAVRGAIPGTGLGLSLVQSIMALHEGRMEIQSKLGAGTCVRLIFPTS